MFLISVQARENDFLMKLLFSATLTNDPNLLSFFNLKYPYYYNITELSHDAASSKSRSKRKTITSETKQSLPDSDDDDADQEDIRTNDDVDDDDERRKTAKKSKRNDDIDNEIVGAKRANIASSLPSTLKISFFVVDEDDKVKL